MRVSNYPILHEADQALFYMELEDNQKAWVKYRLLENRRVDFYSTLVPMTHRSKGLAAMLVDEAFSWAEREGLTIRASCWYAAKKLAAKRETETQGN